MGVFDPGINALSIATHIIPTPFHVTAATLEFLSNCETPLTHVADTFMLGKRVETEAFYD